MEFAKPGNRRARQDDVGPPQAFAITRGSSSSAAGNDVKMRSTSSGKRPLEPGGDDDNTVCGLDVCDELNEYSSDAYVGVTLLRDDFGESASGWCGGAKKFEAYEEVTDETCLSRTERMAMSCRWRDINKGDNERVEARSRLSHFAGTPP